MNSRNQIGRIPTDALAKPTTPLSQQQNPGQQPASTTVVNTPHVLANIASRIGGVDLVNLSKALNGTRRDQEVQNTVDRNVLRDTFKKDTMAKTISKNVQEISKIPRQDRAGLLEKKLTEISALGKRI